jgi:hypothetical protein
VKPCPPGTIVLLKNELHQLSSRTIIGRSAGSGPAAGLFIGRRQTGGQHMAGSACNWLILKVAAVSHGGQSQQHNQKERSLVPTDPSDISNQFVHNLVRRI